MRTADVRYRPDIDGLRALAVVAVLVFHTYPAQLTGGFVGVDVFFVISGFLIGGILMRALDAGTFSFREFYARRIRRIFPALILVLLATLALGWFVLLPDEYTMLGKHSIAGALFSSNLLLWGEAGYFDAAANLKPLLHLWSLGIEEQFYLCWPLILYGIYKLRRYRVALIALAAIASFAFDCYLVSQASIAGFYSPFARIWELLIGVLLAACPAALAGLSSPVRQFLAGLGAAMVVAAMLVYSKATDFPGMHALAPALGSAMIIAAGPGAWVNRFVFANKPAVWIGLISYPLYLWHWPLVVYVRLESIPRGGVMALSAALVLATLTYLLVERPLHRLNLRKVALGLCGLMLLPIAAACAILLSEDMRNRARGADAGLLRQFRTEEAAYSAAYREGTCFLGTDQSADAFKPGCSAKGASPLVLWGDSHAAHLYPGLKSLAPDAASRIAQYTASACPPVLDHSRKDRRHCQAINDFVARELEALPPATVLLTADWLHYNQEPQFLEELAATIARLKAMRHRVVLVGPAVSFAFPQLRVAIRARGAESAENTMLPVLQAADAALRSVAEAQGITYISPVSRLCDNSRCKVTTQMDGERRLLALDVAHLTRSGSDYYATEILRPSLGWPPDQ